MNSIIVWVHEHPELAIAGVFGGLSLAVAGARAWLSPEDGSRLDKVLDVLEAGLIDLRKLFEAAKK